MTATTSYNAFVYGAAQSFGETAVAYGLTAARYAVIGWDWYTATFFSAKAKHTYVTIGEALGHLMIATILVGRIAGIRYRAWVEETVEGSMAPVEATEPAAGEMVEADPFSPEANPHYAPVMAATMAEPVATLVMPVAEVYAEMSTDQLRKACQAAGIRWRNARGQGRHMAKAAMIEALAAA